MDFAKFVNFIMTYVENFLIQNFDDFLYKYHLTRKNPLMRYANILEPLVGDSPFPWFFPE